MWGNKTAGEQEQIKKDVGSGLQKDAKQSGSNTLIKIPYLRGCSGLWSFVTREDSALQQRWDCLRCTGTLQPPLSRVPGSAHQLPCRGSCRPLYPHLLPRHVCPPSVWSDDCKLRKDTFSEAAFNVTCHNARECQGSCLTLCC